MASDPSPADNTVPEEKLDLYSDKFDVLAFLQSDKNKVKVPKPDAKLYDNVAKWYSNYTRDGQPPNREKKPDKTDLPQRRWLPHQLPVPSTKRTRPRKNVFTRMEAVQGPLALLRKYVDEKTRIKILTRNEKGIRGHCIGYLLAFDKHFNLVLAEVDEVWRRSIKVKTNPLFITVPEDRTMRNETKNRVRIPRIETRKISKNTEECRRHVDQMLMRGEHVVLVCPADKES